MMNNPIDCDIRVKGHLSPRWKSWFDGLTIEGLPNGTSRLCGLLPDQSALHGVLDQVRHLGLELVSLACNSTEEGRDGAA
jgi:hypothetical protein